MPWLRQGHRVIRHRPARAEPDPPHRRRARTVCAGGSCDSCQRTLGESRETFRCNGGQERRRHGDGLDDRSGYCVPTELFERNDQVDGVGAESVVLFGDDETVDAGLGEALPELLARLGVTVVPRTDDGGHVGLGQQCIDACSEVLVGGVERESHRSAFGRPSRRSAMTFF